MTQQVLERTVREWVDGNPDRATRELGRLAGQGALRAGQTAEEVADALIRLAARIEIAETRAW